MIKMIALDIDGTLLNSDKKITPQNKQAIQKAKEQGIKIVLCTGRPLMGIHHLLEELDLLNEGDFASLRVAIPLINSLHSLNSVCLHINSTSPNIGPWIH